MSKLRLMMVGNDDDSVQITDMNSGRSWRFDGAVLLAGNKSDKSDQYVALSGNFKAMANAFYLATRDCGENVTYLMREINQKMLNTGTIIGCQDCYATELLEGIDELTATKN